MTISRAEVKTEHGTSYLRQLCRHWAHKYPVEFDDRQGRIELPKAVCSLAAGAEALQVVVEVSDAANQEHMEGAVAEHLQRFGFKETLVFDWVRE